MSHIWVMTKRMHGTQRQQASIEIFQCVTHACNLEDINLLVATETEVAAVLLLASALGNGSPRRGLPKPGLTITTASGSGGGGVLHLLAFLLVASVDHVLDLVHTAALPKTRTSENW